jgi:hypothetical protein
MILTSIMVMRHKHRAHFVLSAFTCRPTVLLVPVWHCELHVISRVMSTVDTVTHPVLIWHKLHLTRIIFRIIWINTFSTLLCVLCSHALPVYFCAVQSVLILITCPRINWTDIHLLRMVTFHIERIAVDMWCGTLAATEFRKSSRAIRHVRCLYKTDVSRTISVPFFRDLISDAAVTLGRHLLQTVGSDAVGLNAPAISTRVCTTDKSKVVPVLN